MKYIMLQVCSTFIQVYFVVLDTHDEMLKWLDTRPDIVKVCKMLDFHLSFVFRQST